MASRIKGTLPDVKIYNSHATIWLPASKGTHAEVKIYNSHATTWLPLSKGTHP